MLHRFGCANGTSFLIEEFAAGADSAATPINTINLPLGSAVSIAGGGPVRVDGAGNIFTSLDVVTPGTVDSIVLYGFAPNVSGNAPPIVQFAPPYNTSFAVN